MKYRGHQYRAVTREANPAAQPSQDEATFQKPTQEQLDFFKKRTQEHIDRVVKFMQQLEGFNGFTAAVLEERARLHDRDKYTELALPYIWITEYYRVKNETGSVPDELQQQYDLAAGASGTHVQQNPHHPEAHGSPEDMSDLDLVEMVADWSAMAEELGQGSCRGWADENVNTKWQFSDQQTELIYAAIDWLEGKGAGEEKTASRKPEMIYTLGRTGGYEETFRTNPNPKKVGRRSDYPGGSVWQTKEEAQAFVDSLPNAFGPDWYAEDFSVYGVLANWETGVYRGEEGVPWNNLKEDSRLVKLDSVRWSEERTANPSWWGTAEEDFHVDPDDEVQIQNVLAAFDDLLDIQLSQGNYDFNPYMHGMANGMLLMRSIVSGEDPEYLEAPDRWRDADRERSAGFRDGVRLCRDVARI